MKIELEHVLPADDERRSFAIVRRSWDPGPLEGLTKEVILEAGDSRTSADLLAGEEP
ncbi:MAG: hypothetical protein ACLU9S_11825 [Oscillospiraceae bacterium]